MTVKKRTNSCAKLTLALLPLLTSCASAPTVPPKPVPCPVPPALDPLPPDVLERDYIGRMESFLSGKLPPDASAKPSSKNAEQGTKDLKN